MKKRVKVVKGRAAGIVLEDIDSKLELIAENVGSMREEMNRKFDHLSTEVEGLKEEMVGVRVILHRHDAKLQKHDEEIADLKSKLVH